MMQYKNAKTGALIETICHVAGGDWLEVQPLGHPPAAAVPAQDNNTAQAASEHKKVCKTVAKANTKPAAKTAARDKKGAVAGG